MKDLLNEVYCRNIGEFEKDTLEIKGVRPNDKIIIRPMYGRKRTRSLTRTAYEISSSGTSSSTVDKCTIKLPDFSDHSFLFGLNLCSNSNTNQKQFSRYILKAYGEIPFKINGIFCHEAYVERGDVVDIGYNRLEFLIEESDEINQENLCDPNNFLGNINCISSNIGILLEGETGTGKSHLAKEIHKRSQRLGHFVHINLSSFSNSLIESELFGHVKGAFTGAINSKKGAFLEANGGTLFLDEIDSLPTEIQIKLLLFLDNKEVRPVGGGRCEKTDVRMIFASSTPLLKLVKDGRMRKDFYYRITSEIVITLDPLHKCPEMIDKLCKKIVLKEKFNISNKLIEFYKTLKWPGNVRQFIGHLNKKKIMSKSGRLDFDKIDEDLMNIQRSDIGLEDENSFMSLDELKYTYAEKVYRYCNCNITQSAKVLKITNNTLRTFLNKKRISLQESHCNIL